MWFRTKFRRLSRAARLTEQVHGCKSSGGGWQLWSATPRTDAGPYCFTSIQGLAVLVRASSGTYRALNIVLKYSRMFSVSRAAATLYRSPIVHREKSKRNVRWEGPLQDGPRDVRRVSFNTLYNASLVLTSDALCTARRVCYVRTSYYCLQAGCGACNVTALDGRMLGRGRLVLRPLYSLVLYLWATQNSCIARARRTRAGFRKFP
jgi:hypothetical protein